MNYLELKEKYSAITTEARQMFDAGLNAENQDKFDSLMNESDNVQKQIAIAEKLESNEAYANAPGKRITSAAKPIHDEVAEYSLLRAIRYASEGKALDGLEKEVSDEIAKRHGKAAKGFYVPFDMPVPKHRTHKYTGVANPTTALGLLSTQTRYADFIEGLRDRMLATTVGVRQLNDITGLLSFPRLTTASTFGWVDPDGATNVSATNAVIGSVTASPKTAHVFTVISRSLLNQSSGDVEMFVRDDVLQSAAHGVDKAIFASDGTSNSPTGVLYTSSLGSVAMGTNGGTATWASVVSLEGTVEAANGNVGGNAAYVTTPAAKSAYKSTVRSASAATGFIWEADEMNGYPAYSTAAMPATLTKGTHSGGNGNNLSAVLFGYWSNVIVPYWGSGFDMLVDPYTFRQKAGIAISGMIDCDVVVRHPESFAKIVDLQTS